MDPDHGKEDNLITRICAASVSIAAFVWISECLLGRNGDFLLRRYSLSPTGRSFDLEDAFQ
jgi:hypothetical protein